MTRFRAPMVLAALPFFLGVWLADRSFAWEDDQDRPTVHAIVDCAGWSPDAIQARTPRVFHPVEVTPRMLKGKDPTPELSPPYLLDFSSIESSQVLLPEARLPAEWEPKEALLLGGTNRGAEGILEALQTVPNKPPIYVLDDESEVDPGLWYHRLSGAPFEKLPVSITDPNSTSSWPRDSTGLFIEYAPYFGPRVRCLLQNEATKVKVCPSGEKTCLSRDCPASFPGSLEGGFILSDGAGMCATTQTWFDEGAKEITLLQKANHLRSYLGCRRILVLVPNDDVTGHVDMIFKFVPRGEVMAAYLDTTDKDSGRFNDNIWFLRQLQDEGVIASVHPVYLPRRALVPMGKNNECREFTGPPFPYPPLVNAYLLNERTALVPQFHPKLILWPDWPEEIRADWDRWWDGINRRLLRDFESAGFSNAVPTDATGFIAVGPLLGRCKNSRGGIHCTLNEVPSLSP